MYEGCTRNNYHLYMFRYEKEQFGGLERAKFFTAMKKEGITCHAGYTPLHTDPYVHALRKNKHYQRLYSKESLDRWESHTHCPQNDKLCAEGVWFDPRLPAGRQERHGSHCRGDRQDPEARGRH